jgi:hypothetical protein
MGGLSSLLILGGRDYPPDTKKCAMENPIFKEVFSSKGRTGDCGSAIFLHMTQSFKKDSIYIGDFPFYI